MARRDICQGKGVGTGEITGEIIDIPYDWNSREFGSRIEEKKLGKLEKNGICEKTSR